MGRWSRSACPRSRAPAAPALLALALATGVAVAAGLAPAPVRADPRAAIDEQTAACLEQALGTAGMLACLAEGALAWERDLERTLSALSRRLPPEERALLETSQRHWQSWREAQFRWLQAAYGLLDGSLYRVLHASDRLELVRARARALADLQRLLEEERTQ
ncbi:lysozyme inhibitor LprI family protein [Cyanobium sp. CH-040]|uniref:lysozyme inhibitor LprI family protein n=1 Tax=Cyanobium sp. CH-040 TaxID=2823708 RepID=UPI0020CC49EC|nr:lysozyme inhibitor LprI family protein [Cyanobium sp. CH-040]MCP9927088.1 DUF1311 domain-containing protein [Cyanobium sp. CH-040]